MNWNNLREDPLKEVFEVLEEAFHLAGIDYYLIGAIAKNVWYTRAGQRSRDTKDVDLAILVGNKEEYDRTKQYLVDHKGFYASTNNKFSLITPSGITLDILPFGGMDIDNPTGLVNTSINGFNEVYRHGTASLEVQPGHTYKVATLPSITLLKLIAYDDRPEHRHKDAGDIGNLIVSYATMERDFIYEHHNDLFMDSDSSPAWTNEEELSATVIGREIGKIAKDNPALYDRLKNILQGFIDQGANSAFVREIVRTTGKSVNEVVNWLQRMKNAL
jgi:predicted nucleotidyltransferase